MPLIINEVYRSEVLFRNMSVLTDWGETEIRKSLTTTPAVLNKRSHGTLVAGIDVMR